MKINRGWMLLLAFAGCAAPMTQIQGESVYEERWNTDQAELVRRSQFDFKCGQTPTLTLLKVSEGTATAVGVDVCGQRATYVRQIDAFRNPGTWVLNVSDPFGSEQKPK
ncbi:MAG: hypothetical protein ACOZIN_00615 [Myxococcota bacterium]